MIDVNNYPFLGFKKQNDAFEKQKKENYSRIYSHEAAHKAAAGSLGGPIVIEYNADGMPVGGHVSIRIPSVDKSNPDKTISEAKQVRRAALAPGSDLSEADLNVADKAQLILVEAQALKRDSAKSGNTLDIAG